MSCQGQTHKEENEVAGSDLQITEAVKAEEVQVQTTTEGASIIKLNMYEYANWYTIIKIILIGNTTVNFLA